jgi:hypothetical protein
VCLREPRNVERVFLRTDMWLGPGKSCKDECGHRVDKKTQFGRAGEYFAMSEVLLRGWNVAVPVVDVGDDVFVIDDNDKTTWRLQVKTATLKTTEPTGVGALLNANSGR